MRYKNCIVFAACAWSLLSIPLCAQTPNAPQVIERHQGNMVNVQTVGDLAPTQQLECIDLNEAKDTYTPPDLHTGIAKCLAKGDLNRAVRLFMLAGIYARFDVARVADRSVQDGGHALNMRTFAAYSTEQKQQFMQAIRTLAGNPEAFRTACAEVSKIGPPAYFPQYLVLHGLNAMMPGYSSDHALVADFDASGTWAKLKLQYLKCPA